MFGDTWFFFDCSTGTNLLALYYAKPIRVLSNETVTIDWLMWIGATNPGGGQISADMLTTNVSAATPMRPIVSFLDSGVILAATNTPNAIGVGVPIGNWSGLANTVLTNRLTLNLAVNTYSFTLNGTVLTNLPLDVGFTNYLEQFRISMREFTDAQSPGNRFALNDVRITLTPDVSTYAVLKGRFLSQTNTAAPQPQSDSPFIFMAQVNESSSGTVIDASVQPPGGDPQSLFEDLLYRRFMAAAMFSTSNEMNAACPDGNYTLTITGNSDAVRFPTLNLVGSDYPNPPRVSNWTSAQSVIPANPFNLTWDAFSGGTTNDFIQMAIYNLGGGVVFQTPDFGFSGALKGTNTDLTIPAGTLVAGVNYEAALTFAKRTDVNLSDYPGTLGFAGYFTQTRFTMDTAAADSVGDGIPDWWRAAYFGGSGQATNSQSAANADPDGDGVSNMHEYQSGTVPTNMASFLHLTGAVHEGGNIRVSWSAAPGKIYVLQTSTNLLTDRFTNAANQIAIITVPATSPTTLTNYLHVGGATNGASRFYRVACLTGFNLLTPYVNESDMAVINEAYSDTDAAPWGFVHKGIGCYPTGDFKPFQAVAPGIVQWINLVPNEFTSAWQVDIGIKYDATSYFGYYFEPGTSASLADGQLQLSNIVVSVGQSVSPGAIIGYLHAAQADGQVHFGIKKNGQPACPESHFISPARESILRLLQVRYPSANMCY
jgi:hypothetical protein